MLLSYDIRILSVKDRKRISTAITNAAGTWTETNPNFVEPNIGRRMKRVSNVRYLFFNAYFISPLGVFYGRGPTLSAKFYYTWKISILKRTILRDGRIINSTRNSPRNKDGNRLSLFMLAMKFIKQIWFSTNFIRVTVTTRGDPTKPRRSTGRIAIWASEPFSGQWQILPRST